LKKQKLRKVLEEYIEANQSEENINYLGEQKSLVFKYYI
jgi:hypothetical protein